MRCGKQRIVTHTWIEFIETFSGARVKQTNTDSVCPDSECQKIVDKELKAQQQKREKMRLDKEKNKNNNIRGRKK